MYIGNTRQMYPSQFCRRALRRIGFLQFAQLKEVSSFSCNQFVVHSLSIFLFSNIKGSSTSRKQIGHFRQLFLLKSKGESLRKIWFSKMWGTWTKQHFTVACVKYDIENKNVTNSATGVALKSNLIKSNEIGQWRKVCRQPLALENKICQQNITPCYGCIAVFRQAAFPPAKVSGY